MNYELAKELKDAGFPLKEHMERGTNVLAFGEGVIYSRPTLSELIEACGEQFADLSKGQPPIDAPWTATALLITVFAQGSTPEEAVARLWLALKAPLKI